MQEYNETDQRIHLLSQVVTKVNRTYVPEEKDDSHTNLYFDPIEQRVMGRWFSPVNTRFIFALNLVHFQFELLDNKQNTVRTFSISEKTVQELEAEIEVEFQHLGFDTTGLTKKLHYDITPYEFAHSKMKSPDQKNLIEWTSYRSMANTACNDLLGLSQKKGEIRIWPHHFDTGIHIEPSVRMGIGFGLAMKDNMVGSPYFYFSGYPKAGEINYEDAPTSDHWVWYINKYWKGCTLSLNTLKGFPEVDRNDIIFNFQSTVYQWLIKQ